MSKRIQKNKQVESGIRVLIFDELIIIIINYKAIAFLGD